MFKICEMGTSGWILWQQSMLMEASKALKQRRNLWYVGHGFALNFWTWGAELWVLGPLTLLQVHPDSVLEVDLSINFLQKAFSLRGGSVSLLGSRRWDSSFPERTQSFRENTSHFQDRHMQYILTHVHLYTHLCFHMISTHTCGVYFHEF